MTRPTGGSGSTVHVGKAAAIIVVAALIGILVLYKNDSGGGLSAAERAAASAAANSGTTTTTEPDSGDSGVTPTTAALRSPASIKVIAINGTTTPKLGAKATTKLTGAGYNAVAPGDATTKSATASSVIYVRSGYEREGAAVAALFGLPASAVRALPSPAPSAAIKDDTNIVVFIGTGITLT